MRDTKETYQTISETFLQIVNEQSDDQEKIDKEAILNKILNQSALKATESRLGGATPRDHKEDPRFPEGLHLGLDIGGTVPVAGNIADLINAALYAVEERPAMAGVSLLAALPGIGIGVGAAKIGMGAAKGKLAALAGAGKTVATTPSKGIATGLGKVGATARAGRALTKAEQILTKQGLHTPDEISDALKALHKLDPSKRLGRGGAEAITTATKEAGESLSGFGARHIDIGSEAWKQVEKARGLLAGTNKWALGVTDPDKLLHAKRLFSAPGAGTRAAMFAGSEIEAAGYPGEEEELGAAAQKTRAKGHAQQAVETGKEAYQRLQDYIKGAGFHSGTYGH